MCLSTKCVPASKKFYRSPLFVFLHSEIPSYFWTEQQSNMAMLTFIRNPHTKKGIFDISFPVFPITKLSPNLFLFFRHHSEWTFLSCYLFYSLNPQSTTPFSLSSCSVSQSVQSLYHCLTLCDPMDCSTPGLPVPHHLLKFAQVDVHFIYPWWCHPAISFSDALFSSVLNLSPSWITALSRQRGLRNSTKLWAMPCRATQYV